MSHLDDMCSEMGIDTLSESESQIISLMTKWCNSQIQRQTKKNLKEIASLKKRIVKLEEAMKGLEPDKNDKKGGDAAAPAPPEKKKNGNIMVSEYQDAFLITGNTFHIKDMLKSDFRARWSPDCKGWKILKTVELPDCEKPEDIIIVLRAAVEPYIERCNYVRDNADKPFSDLFG